MPGLTHRMLKLDPVSASWKLTNAAKKGASEKIPADKYAQGYRESLILTEMASTERVARQSGPAGVGDVPR